MHCVDFAVIGVRCFFLKRLLYYFRASITSKEMRGDIGGFGAAANSAGSWQFYGSYSHAFEFSGLKFASLVGYRALGLDYSMRLWGRQGERHQCHCPSTDHRRQCAVLADAHQSAYE
jgi:hypothetical protein